jgi:sterol desaturase/sphingolipid hydroxylase (fatty acid hydroxylase superfamily)
MIGIPVGWAYAHVGEWALHRYLLHGPGRKRASMWSFHFHDHHATTRTSEFEDPMYESHPFKWNAAGKEVLSLAALAAAHLPLVPIAPFFVATVAVSGIQYYRIHKRSHLEPEWCRENVPWHYDHHMGPDQHKNWGVRRDWVDRLMGTREVYVGTEREERDIKRRAERALKKMRKRAA